MNLYVVVFEDKDGEYWTEPYLADDFDHAEEQCKNANPADIRIIDNARISSNMIRRAYFTL